MSFLLHQDSVWRGAEDTITEKDRLLCHYFSNFTGNPEFMTSEKEQLNLKDFNAFA